jgi:colanic acid biosynthesis glycosyl transferase WcaI
MHVTLVSQYYSPEIGATQNRMSAFARGLADRGHRVTVVCEQPNHPSGVYPQGWGTRPWMTERSGTITIHRLWVATSPVKTSARRLAFYGSFAAGALAALLALPRTDVVFATSPPLPGAWAAAMAARLRRVPLVLDVRDLWPAAAEALGEVSNASVMRVLEAGERWVYRAARRVTATTRPFCRHIDSVAGRPVAFHLPNGGLDDLLALPARAPDDGPFTVGYAGNFGIAQGLSVVFEAAEALRGCDIRFRLVGSGPLRTELEDECHRRGLTNVAFEPAVPVTEIGDFLQSCHALWIPLRDHVMLSDFIPSKLYDAMAVGRPAIVGAGAEAAALAAETGCGVTIAPEDALALAGAVRDLAADRDRAGALGAAGRMAAPRFARSRQVERLIDVLDDAARAPGSNGKRLCAGS